MRLGAAVALVCAGAPMLATARASSPQSTTDLAKRGVVGDLFLGLGDALRSKKIDLNGVLVKGVDGLRNVSSTIDFNKAVNKGFSDAIDQNTQLSQLPLGRAVGGVIKQLLAGVDYNSLITGDVMNFLEGASREVDVDAVALSGVDALAATLNKPSSVETASSNTKSKGAAVSAAMQFVSPLSDIPVVWCSILALATLVVHVV